MRITRPTLLYLLVFTSGLAGLGYELTWTGQLSTGLGHEIAATLAVISAFFAGLALGSWLLDAPLRRTTRPALWYALLEAFIGGWSLLLWLLMPRVVQGIATYIGVEPTPLWQWTIAFTLPLLCLLPATVAMGGTLPAAEQLLNALVPGSRAVSNLYAVNTLGAVAGIGLTLLLTIPAWGYSASGALLAAANGIGVGGALAFRRVIAPTGGSHATAISHGGYAGGSLGSRLFASGLLGIGYEVLVVRVASQVLENTIYSFAGVLAVYLFGTALGAVGYRRFAPRDHFQETLTILFPLTSVLCLLGMFLLWQAAPLYGAIRVATGGGVAGSVCGELAVAAAVLLLPTAAMGATFSHLAQRAADSSFGLGRALALNTLGGALAPVLFGVLLLPLLGSVSSLLLIVIGYVVLSPRPPRTAWSRRLVPVALALLAGLWLKPVQLVDQLPGDRLLAHVEGVMAAVTVIEDTHGNRHLTVNNRFQMGGTASAYSDQRQAHLPLLLHPQPRRALFLGVGTGITFAAARWHPQLLAEGVELVPEIAALTRYFQPAGGSGPGNERWHLTVADARRYVRATPHRYDVIIADLFHPSRDGAGALYTVEHFQAIRARLAPGGLFVQWLPLYQLDLDTLRTIIRSYLQAFPDAYALLAHFSLKAPLLGLAGGHEPFTYSPGWLARRVSHPALARELAALRLSNDYELFGCLLADAPALRAFAGRGPLNSDDQPVVTFAAPRFAYANPLPAVGRLLALLDALSPGPPPLFTTDTNADFRARLTAYSQARDQFLRTGAGIAESSDVQGLVQQLREPLLAVVRISPDFAAAYNPLLALAYRLHRVDPPAARQLLWDLETANPARTEAGELRRRLLLE